jgi:outer membrane receptor for ferrienterochelin and colicins
MNTKIRKLCLTILLMILFALIFSGDAFSADANEPSKSVSYFDMDLEELLDVQVSVASKKEEPQYEAPGVVVVVPRSEIEIYGDRNLHQLLQRQPSVYTRDDFVYAENNASFRGDMATVAEMHTLVLLNGRPIRESAQGQNVNMYLTFPMTSLESVELIRGPGSVLYGSNAFTGVVNLKTRPVPEHREFSVSTMGGSYRYYDIITSYGEQAGDLGIVADVRAAGQHGYEYALTDMAGVYGEDNKYDKSVSGTAHLEYKNFTFDFFGSDLNSFALGVFPFWSNTNHKIRNKKLFTNLGYRHPIYDRMTLEFNVTYNLQENQLSSPRPMLIGTNTSDLLGEVTLYANPIENLNVVTGFLQEHRANYKADKDDFQSIPYYNYEPKSAYAQADYKFGKTVKVIAGTQWNESPLGDSDFVNRYGVIITPVERWGLKLLRGEAFRGPVALETDLYDPAPPPGLVGNKNLKPETITTYDAQLFYHDPNTYAAVTYFNSTINDLIIYNTSVIPFTYMNGGEHKFDGVEFEGKRFISSHWHVLGSYMYQNNKADRGLNPSVVPDQMAKIGTGYTWDWGSAAIFYSYFGTPPRIASPLVVNPSPEPINLVTVNVRLDTSSRLGLKKGQSIVTLRVENLLNEEIYVPTFAYTGSPNSFPFGPGISFYAGLTLKN